MDCRLIHSSHSFVLSSRMSRNTVTSKNTLNRIEHLFTLEARVKIVPWFTSASKMISSSGRRLLPQIPTKSYGGRVISVYQSYSQQNNDSTCPNKNRALPPTNKSLKFTFTEEEYRAAKPFKDIPGPSGMKLATNIVLPWGRYFRMDMLQLSRELQKEYGNLVKLPSFLGKAPVYMCFDCNDAEVIFRNEGPTPFRRNLEIFTIFRDKERPDLFKGNAGLVQE